MKIAAAIDFFEELSKQDEDKSILKVYKRFSTLLSELETTDLTEAQGLGIEEKLKALQLTSYSADKKKYFRKKLAEFTAYLKRDLSLVSEGMHTGLGMSLGISLGMSFGVSMGVVFDNIVYGMLFGMIFGMLVGLAIGAFMDENAKKEGRVIKTPLY